MGLRLRFGLRRGVALLTGIAFVFFEELLEGFVDAVAVGAAELADDGEDAGEFFGGHGQAPHFDFPEDGWIGSELVGGDGSGGAEALPFCADVE